jgi:hypothetical protein
MRRKTMSRFLKSLLPKNTQTLNEDNMNVPSPINENHLSTSLSENLALLKETFKGCGDIVYRLCKLGAEQTIHAVVISTDGLVNNNLVNNDIMKSLMQGSRLLEPGGNMGPQQAFSFILEGLLNIGDVKEEMKMTEIVDSILRGDTAILIDGVSTAIIANTRGVEMRAVSEPETESVVRGPRQGFTENVRTSTALIRRIIKTPQLKMEPFKVGELTKTEIIVAYIQGIADEQVVEEVRLRIQRINVDSILESGYVEELIEDNPFSPFPQIAHTERPDKAAAELLEGRVIILVDGTPFVLIVPTVFIQFLQSSEDYYERYLMSFAIRAIRYLFFAVALVFPSAYIAATTYHQEMLPTSLLISIAGAREGVPFPAFFEALLMEITFEALREAGVRLPKTVGSAISIVGALVIGESAVRAGIVSPAMVIVVGLTAIASFTIPAFNVAITVRLLRFPMMVLAAVLGFYGIILGIIAMLIHMCSLRSFGVPYFSPVAPFEWRGMKDMIFRAPWWKMKKRSGIISHNNLQRQNTPKPEPPGPS